MSKRFAAFPTGSPVSPADKLLISRVDPTSSTGFSNYQISVSEFLAILNGSIIRQGLDGQDGEDGLTVVGPQGVAGTDGVIGRDGLSVTGQDGVDGEDGLTITGAKGDRGQDGGVLYLEPDLPDEAIRIPGERGLQGLQGPAGIGIDGIDADDPLIIPGVAGAAGVAGTNGTSGVSVIGLDGLDSDEPILIPGPKGDTGAAGGASDPFEGSYAPGSFLIPTGDYAIMADSLELIGTEESELQGTATLVII